MNKDFISHNEPYELRNELAERIESMFWNHTYLIRNTPDCTTEKKFGKVEATKLADFVLSNLEIDKEAVERNIHLIKVNAVIDLYAKEHKVLMNNLLVSISKCPLKLKEIE